MQEVFSVEERTEMAAHLSGENRLHGGFRLLFVRCKDCNNSYFYQAISYKTISAEDLSFKR